MRLLSLSIAGSSLLAGVLLLAVASGPPVDAAALRTATAPDLRVATENAIGRRGCLACHRADTASGAHARFAPIAAPDLRASGRELAPRFLRRFLEAPHAVRRDTAMPDLLGHLDAAERTEVVEDLVHYLGSRGGLFDRTPQPSTPGEIERGRVLVSTLGCLSCHDDDPTWRASLAEKTHVGALAAWLREPMRKWPSGMMPDLRIDEEDARAIALHLLGPQAFDASGNARIEEVAGLREAYFEGKFDDCGPSLESFPPTRIGNAPRVALPADHREDYFAVALDGEIEIPRAGRWTFALTSDDGSRLWIGDTEVIDHDGLHSPTRKDGHIELDAGWHPIRVTMFEFGGGQELRLEWQGPGSAFEEVPPERFRLRTTVHRPGGEKLVVDRERRARGQRAYIELGCAACHDRGMAPARAPRFEALPATATGCLDASPGPESHAPRFSIDRSERAELLGWLAARDHFNAEATPERRAALAFDRYDCLGCHARDGVGGPTLEEQRFFLGTAELGDEGRLPPDLTAVGRKLLRPALERVIAHGESVRPYMVTRMPSYGDEVGKEFAALLFAVDGGDDMAQAPPFSEEAVEVGRTLVGGDGFRCIDCHDFAGHDSLGEPAVDLAILAARVQPRWYLEYMHDPQAKRPGTRMPAFWAPGLDLFPDLLDGSARRQIEATWTYLSLGETAPLPSGLVIDRATYDLAPVDEPIVFGAFFEGLSARTICVGLPERISFAYDADHSRLALLWRGEFMNARGTWEGRAGQLETPEGSDPIRLPPGDAIAPLQRWDARWPEVSGRAAGWRHSSVRRDAMRRPIFRRAHRARGVVVEESITPRYAEGKAALVRTIRFAAPSMPTDSDEVWVLRAARAPHIEERDGSFFAEGVRITVRGGEARLIRGEQVGGLDEVRILLSTERATIEMEVEW